MSVHVRPEQVFTMNRNGCSFWAGICNGAAVRCDRNQVVVSLLVFEECYCAGQFFYLLLWISVDKCSRVLPSRTSFKVYVHPLLFAYILSSSLCFVSGDDRRRLRRRFISRPSSQATPVSSQATIGSPHGGFVANVDNLWITPIHSPPSSSFVSRNSAPRKSHRIPARLHPG